MSFILRIVLIFSYWFFYSIRKRRNKVKVVGLIVSYVGVSFGLF